MDFYENTDCSSLQICLVLFQACNLNCMFCFQNHRKAVDISYIQEIPEKIKNDLYGIISRKKYSGIVFRIWGGQVFADFIQDSVFDVYQRLSEKLKRIGDELNIDIQICWSSNFVFEKRERVLEFLKKTEGITATSYDPVYRFHNDSQIRTWSQNLKIFNPICISITLTKQNIKEYISNPVHFRRMTGYNIYIEYYIYSRNYQFFAPSQDDLYDFYQYCINNRINIEQIQLIKKSLGENIGRYCTCDNSCLYLNGKLTFNCLQRSSNLDFSEFFKEIPDQGSYTQIQYREALTRGNCFKCIHFSYCRNFCMASMLHRSYSNQNCALKRIYDKLSQGYFK